MKCVRKTKIKSAIRKTERLFEQLDLTVEEVVIVSSTIHEAEDMEKIRVAYCFVDKQVEIPIDWSKVCPGIPSNPLCGMDWVKEHYNHFTQEDYDKLGITIKTDRREVTITAKNKLKDVRTVIGSLK